MQKQVLIALAVVGTLTAGFFLLRGKPTTTDTSALKDVYNQYKLTYKINVGAGEDDYRFKVFSSNYEKINKHNTLIGRSYNLAVNPFTHITQEEFSATHLGLKIKSVSNVSIKPVGVRADKVDWTDKMNKVKNQGQCGSCWAFSAVGALEGLHSANGKPLVDLSEQELVDCSGGKYGNEGCNGGLMNSSFQYVADVGGLALQSEYGYKGVDGKCNTGKTTRNNKISGFVNVDVNNSTALMVALTKQPVSVAIEADTFTFQFYTSGVITGKSCGTELDHGVVAVGFDSTARQPYYRVRNSWGASWGDKGHVNIGIEDGEGVCGIQMAASYPTL